MTPFEIAKLRAFHAGVIQPRYLSDADQDKLEHVVGSVPGLLDELDHLRRFKTAVLAWRDVDFRRGNLQFWAVLEAINAAPAPKPKPI